MRIRVAIATLIAAAATVSIIILPSLLKAEKLEESPKKINNITLKAQLRSCAQEPMEIKGICQIAATDAAGLEVMDAIKTLVGSVEEGSQCHSGAHDLGKKLWGSYKTILADGVAVEACDYGVVHGAMSAAANSLNFTSLLMLIDETCGREDRACWHGAGHAFTDLYTDPAEIMKACSVTSQARMCAGGAAMELALRRNGTTYSICENLENEAQFECDFQVAYAFGSKVAQSTKNVEECLNLNRPGCAIGSGWAGYTYSDTRMKSAIAYCSSYGKFADACAGGVLMAERAKLKSRDIVEVCRSGYTLAICNRVLEILSKWYR